MHTRIVYYEIHFNQVIHNNDSLVVLAHIFYVQDVYAYFDKVPMTLLTLRLYVILGCYHYFHHFYTSLCSKF